MPDIPVFDLLGDELGVADETTATAARVIADALGPGSAVQAARIANALRDAGVLDSAKQRPLPAPDTVEDDGDAEAVYWHTPSGTVTALTGVDTIVLEHYGYEIAMDIAESEDNAHAVLAAVQHLRNNSNATK